MNTLITPLTLLMSTDTMVTLVGPVTPIIPITNVPLTPVTPIESITNISKTSKELTKENKKLWRSIHKLNREIAIKKEIIQKNESTIFKTCDHEWEYDTSCGPYERIKYKCTKCNLWKSNSMYSCR